MPDHDEFFRRNCKDYSPDQMDQMRERPNTEIKVRICPNQSHIPNQLYIELQNDHNMNLYPSDSNKDIYIVSGIPPNNGFGEHKIMEVVRKYAPYAVVVP